MKIVRVLVFPVICSQHDLIQDLNILGDISFLYFPVLHSFFFKTRYLFSKQICLNLRHICLWSVDKGAHKLLFGFQLSHIPSSMAPLSLNEKLAAIDGVDVLLPGTPDYIESNTSYSSIYAATFKPLMILQPTNSKSVASIIKILKPITEAGLIKVAIRGSGDTLLPGAANVDNGVLIDTRSLLEMALIDEKSIFSFGVGRSWRDIFGALESDGLAVAGDRSSRRDVGGVVVSGMSI